MEKAGVTVDAKQIKQVSGILCDYQVTNGSQKSVSGFTVGGGPNGAFELPVLPLNWTLDKDGNPNPSGPEMAPTSWSESILNHQGSQTGFIMQWQSKEEMGLKPGGHIDFKMEFPNSSNVRCDKFTWNVALTTIYPPSPSAPTSLSMVLSNLKVLPHQQFEGDIVIQNLGPNDTMINLGITVANGARSYPTGVSLVARSANGKIQKLGSSEPETISGRYDPMVVPLPLKAVYSVHAKWSTFPALSPGSYEFNVEFEGTSVRAHQGDMQGMNLIKSWIGKVESNKIKFNVL